MGNATAGASNSALANGWRCVKEIVRWSSVYRRRSIGNVEKWGLRFGNVMSEKKMRFAVQYS